MVKDPQNKGKLQITLGKIFETCKRQKFKILKILPINSKKKRKKERKPIKNKLKVMNRKFIKNINGRASLVAQWLRICLAMQGTRVRALVWEDPTCRRATRPVSHNY